MAAVCRGVLRLTADNTAMLGRLQHSLTRHGPVAMKMVASIQAHLDHPHTFPFAFYVMSDQLVEVGCDSGGLTVVQSPDVIEHDVSIGMFSSGGRDVVTLLKQVDMFLQTPLDKPILLFGINGQCVTALGGELRLQTKYSSTEGEVDMSDGCPLYVLRGVERLTPAGRDPRVVCRPLTPSDAALVNSKWKFGGGAAGLKVVTSCIRCCVTRGVYVEGELVSWALCQPYGAIGMVHTVTEHRGQGLARLAVSGVARDMVRLTTYSYAFIENYNETSRRMFESLGFVKEPATNNLHWIIGYKTNC